MKENNTLIGTLLLGLLVFGMFYYTNQTDKKTPSKANSSTSVASKDSSATVSDVAINSPADTNASTKDSAGLDGQYGPFAMAAKGEAKDIIIENELQKITLSAKGGTIKSVELKQYKTWDKKPLILFNSVSQEFSYQFVIEGNKIVSTKDLYFEPSGASFEVKGEDSKTVAFKLKAADGQYFEQRYTLKGNDYKVGYELNVVGMEKIMPNSNDLQINWKSTLPNQEHSVETERRYSALYYKYANDNVAHLDEDKAAQAEAFTGKVDWVSFKQQFFNATLFGTNMFKGSIKADFDKAATNYVKKYDATLLLDYHPAAKVSYAMNFYFGPNRYATLKKSGDGFENIIKLGYDNVVFGWIKYITKWAIIPTFNILETIGLNYGIIILLLTILLKLVLTPLTWSAIKSAASMKVLKPEIDELKVKYGDDQSKISTEQMKIYSKAGVSPFGGCLPMVLQMPILLAMYLFFPNSIELRQAPFLWAADLSSYDAFVTFPQALPLIGSHLSLFALLMTVTSILSAIYTQSQSGMTNAQPGMQYMPYIMPVFLFFMFNGFPAALTYYYLLQNVLSMGQQWAIQKFFIDEAALHRKIQENKKKPSTKSGWMKKLEDIQRQAEQQRKK